MKPSKPSTTPLVVAGATAVFFLGAAYYAISAGKEVVYAIERIAEESPQIYIVPEKRDIGAGDDQPLIASPAITFSDMLFRVPWQGEPQETRGIRGITYAYPDGRSVTVVRKEDQEPRAVIEHIFGDGAQPVMERLASAYGPGILEDPFLFLETVLSSSPENITFLTLQSRAETERILLLIKQDASILNENIYAFNTRYVRGFQFGKEDDTIIAVDLFKRDGTAYSLLIKGVPQEDIDLMLASIR